MKIQWKQVIGIIVAIFLCFTIHANYDRWSEVFLSTLKCSRPYSEEDLKNEILLKTKAKLFLYKYLKKYRYAVFGLIFSILAASIYMAYQINSGIVSFDIHSVPDWIRMVGILSLVKPEDNRFTAYETHEMRTITINSPLTFRFPADSIEYKTIMAIALSHAKVQPQAKYQRNCFSNASIATMVDLPSGQTIQSMNTNYKNHGLEGLIKLTPGELLKAEEKEKALQYLKEDIFLTPNKIAKRLKKEGHTSVSVGAVKNSLKNVDLTELLFHFRSQVTGENINKDKDTLIEMLFMLIKDLSSHQDQSTCITVDREALYEKYHDIRSKQINMKREETKKRRDSGILKYWKRLHNMKPYMEDRLKCYLAGIREITRCPGCKTTDIHVKQTRKRLIQNKDGDKEEVEVTSYTCNNSSCSRKTFTVYTGDTLPYLRSAKRLICYAFSQRFKRVSYSDIDLKDIGDGRAEVEKGTIARWVVWASIIMPRWYTVFEPRTTGQIAIDEKYAKVRGRWHYVFIAIDIASFDILHIEVYKTRDKDSARHFLYTLKSFGFTFDTIITDGTTIYSEPIAKLFPEAKHIKCVLHLGPSCRNRLMKVFGSYRNKHYLYLKDYIIPIYQAKSEKEFNKAMKDWEVASKHIWELHGDKYPKLQVFMDKFAQDKEKNKERLKDINSPRTTNNVERVIQEFEKRYCNMEGFDTLEAARGWCKLFQVYFRLRPFGKGKFKGTSPAEIMGYDVKNLDNWLDFVIPPDTPGTEKVSSKKIA